MGLSKPCILLIVIAGMERFAFKGVAANLVTYLTDVAKMSNSSAAKAVNSWVGFTSIIPLLIAPLADSYWDPYATILVSCFLYVLGLMALTSTTLFWSLMSRATASAFFALFSSLCLISVAVGGFNSSLQAFGVNQLEPEEDLPVTKEEPPKSSQKTIFFQWWYFGVCTGSLCGVSILAYIEDTVSWSIGFGIPTVSMILSIALFSAGTKFYIYKEDDRNLEGSKSGIKAAELVRSIAANILRSGGRGTVSEDCEMSELELEQQPLCSKAYDEIKDTKASPCTESRKMDNVRVIKRLIPIWTMLLTFAVIFQQPATFFTKQGMTMRRDIGLNFKIPPATLQSAITISIIALMPFYDKLLVPMIQMITRNKKGVSVFERIGVGMVLSILAMIIAALVESTRLHMITQLGLGPQDPVPLSIFWLLPQYILLGISDIFTVVGMQEFFHGEVPERMKTMGIALYTSVFGVGSFVSALLITLVQTFTKTEGGHGGWFADDMREARLDNYYWLLTVLSVLSLLAYVLLCRCFKSIDSIETQTEASK